MEYLLAAIFLWISFPITGNWTLDKIIELFKKLGNKVVYVIIAAILVTLALAGINLSNGGQ